MLQLVLYANTSDVQNSFILVRISNSWICKSFSNRILSKIGILESAEYYVGAISEYIL